MSSIIRKVPATTLKGKMTLVVLAMTAVVLSVSGWLGFGFFQKEFKASLAGHQFTLVSALAEQIDDKTRIAQDHLVAISRMITPEMIVNPDRAQRFLSGQLDDQNLFDSGLFLFSARGELLASIQEEPLVCNGTCLLEPHLRRTLATGTPCITEPFLSAGKDRRPVILFTAPVRAPGGPVIGVVAGALDLLKDNFLGHLAEVQLGESGYLYLYNQQRTIIVHPQRSRILQRDVLPGANVLFDRALAGWEGTGETVNSRGLPVLAAFSRLPTTGWILAANFPQDEAYAPLVTARRFFWLGTVGMVLLTTLGCWLVMRRLTAPLRRLTARIQGIGDSAPFPPIPLETRDEIGALAAAFNDLLARLTAHERTVKEQLDFLQVLIDVLPSPVFYKDAAGRYLGCNQAFEKAVGHSREYLTGKTVFDIAPPDLASIYAHADADLFAQGAGKTQVYETSVVYANGERRQVIFYKANFPAPTGGIGGLIGSFLDITERQRAEAALAEEKQFSERLLQNAAVAGFVLDAGHQVIAWNHACEKLTGIRAEDVLGTAGHWRAFYPQRRPCLADFIIDGTTGSISDHYANCARSALVAEGWQAEGWLKLNGRPCYILFHAAPICNGDGKVVAAIQTLEDLTARRMAEEKLRQSFEQVRKLSLAVEQSRNTVVITDLEGRIEYVNPRFTEVTGYTVEEAIGQNPRILQGGSTPEEYYRTLWETISAGGEWRGEFENRKKDGELFWETALISPLKNAEGAITHYVAIKEDITGKTLNEQRQKLTTQVLELLSLPSRKTDKIQDILQLIKDFSGIEGIGIRLQEGEDFPYYRTCGLDEGHVEAENLLRPRLHTEDGIADCLCGRVLLGQAGNRSPFFTEGGSFWLNRQEDWPELDGAGSCHRGECFRSGFNSLALIPLRSGDRVVGLIQLVDRKPAAISLETIRFLEGIGVSVGIAFEHRQAEVRLQENENRLDFLTNYDPLTRLPNRTLLQDRLLHAMAKARRSGKKVAVLLLDLDRFKTINDSLGHDLGDRLLVHVADRLRALVREGDTLARFSGDEFVVVLEEVEELKSGMFVAQKMLAHLSEVIRLENYPLYLTGSIGITFFPNDAEDLDSLLKYAEVAMYRAKEGGRNAYQFYRPDMNARSRELLLLESSLRQALAQEQLTLFFQPKVELRTGRILGAEALVRWRHPELGMMSPAEFIPLTEETGLIVPIGEWILESACRHLVAWQETGCPPLRVAVNISGRQFQQPDFVRMVEAILRRTGADADLLELEITESTAMENAEETIRTLTTLKAMGVQLAIDDFGTGHSSLSYLRRFPIDCLKIDRSFVRDAAYNPNDAAIAAAIIALARGMSLSVVAEGIETRAQMDFLLQQGCAIGQGFLFSRPVPPGEWEELRRRTF